MNRKQREWRPAAVGVLAATGAAASLVAVNVAQSHAAVSGILTAVSIIAWLAAVFTAYRS